MLETQPVLEVTNGHSGLSSSTSLPKGKSIEIKGLVPLKTFLAHNEKSSQREVLNLIHDACSDRMIDTVAEVTDDDLVAAINDPHNFWRVAISNDPYTPVIGVVSLQKFNPVDGTGEMGVAVTAHLRGEGWGPKLVLAMRSWAVATLNLRRMTNFILADSPGIGVATKLGDTLEGTLRAYRYKNGSYVDVHIYSWLREV